MVEIVESNKEHEKALANVFLSIGRSLIMYQRIEQQLKMLLPNMGSEDEGASSSPLEEVKRLSDSKITMGPLFERFKGSVSSSHPEGFSEYLYQVVENRNELIHKFSKLSFGKLSSIEDCNEALSYLRGRDKYAAPLSELLEQLLRAYIDVLSDPNEVL